MEWYYAEGQQQRGPVTEAELDNLVRAGTVKNDTLVWREGMANWQSYAEARGGVGAGVATVAPPVAGGVVCSQCGRSFPQDDVIRYGELWVCAGCKPAFVQRLKEGAALPGVVEYAGFWIRFVAKFVDGLILRFVGLLINVVGVAAMSALGDPIAVSVLIIGLGLIVDILYQTLFVGALGATPGKLAARVRVVNADGSKVSYAKAFARALAEYLNLLTLLIGYIIAAFDDQKRALHDRICGTRVIKKTS